MTLPPRFIGPAEAARQAGRSGLGRALGEARARTLALFAAYESALGATGFAVPLSAELNPPLWELGHIGWFQEWWLARNRERGRGVACNPDIPRPPSRLAGADALYHSGQVPHDSRWQLPLPDAQATRAYLQAELGQTLALLAESSEDDAALYFFRLSLFHEDMHAEAAVYMAQSLGLPLPAEVAWAGVPAPRATGPEALQLPARAWTLGRDAPGFAFDNELGLQQAALAAFEIDAAPVDWARYLPFVEAGGYAEPRWWSAEGWQWLGQSGLAAPRYLRRHAGGWQAQAFGIWQPLDPAAAARHLSWHEAQAWCRWAGRRLPSEAEWECAALTQPGFAWGQVWEWTATTFEPFPGFTPHPYRDYSAPWFGTRPVLRGASRATAPRMAHPKYRNFFTPERNEIFAGFRSCA
jgi:ergothioneine biosynthesis protein EgtB